MGMYDDEEDKAFFRLFTIGLIVITIGWIGVIGFAVFFAGRALNVW